MARIVVMDDEATVRTVVERVMKKEGHEVLVFEDAAPALAQVDFRQVDLVITDLVMPTPGDQFILILQQDDIEVPVIVLSAHLTDARTEYLRELGINRILEKPFEVAKLIQMVRKVLA
ncbi:MAG: response regulator [bacterium]|nr:response regulator [bacterium]